MTAATHPALPPAIVVEHLTKRYGERTALDDVSLRVPQGSVLALLGHNGAGKTTLVRVLTTLIRPDGGSALVAGHDVVGEAAAVRRRIALVGQHAAVDEYLTGRENLLLVARLLRMGRTERHHEVAAALGSFGLAEVADAPAATYSGGMRRRLDIAVTLLAKPSVIFLDEPTTGLDPVSRLGLWTLVERLVAGGTTVLLTTQYLEEADRLAGLVAVIDQGRLVATGTPDELKRRLGGDTVRLELAPEATPADATAALGGAGVVDAVPGDERAVELRGPDGAALLPQALHRLQAHGLAVTAAEVRRPGLDDVFIALTGRRGTSAPVPPAGAAHAAHGPHGAQARHGRAGHHANHHPRSHA